LNLSLTKPFHNGHQKIDGWFDKLTAEQLIFALIYMLIIKIVNPFPLALSIRNSMMSKLLQTTDFYLNKFS